MTDGAGIYRIVNLDPRTYRLTFTLQGFSQVKREEVQLSGAATLTIPVEMQHRQRRGYRYSRSA